MHTRQMLALAACSSIFLIACTNQQASVTSPADEGTTESAAVGATDEDTDEGAAVEVEVGAEAVAE